MIDESRLRHLAAVSASQAANATAMLLQIHQEGPIGAHSPWDPFGDDPIDKLADATKLAIEAAEAGGDPPDEERAQLYVALCCYLEGAVP